MTEPTDEQFLRDHDFGFLAGRAMRRFPCGEFWTDPGRCDRETILKLIALLEPGDPIHIDVPDREQLLADADAVLNDIEVCERGSHYFVDGADVDDVLASAKRLAAHTRRTLGEK